MISEAPRDVSVPDFVATRGGRPSRPTDPATAQPIVEDLWSLVQRCWEPNPSSRPVTDLVMDTLKCIEAAQTRSPGAGSSDESAPGSSKSTSTIILSPILNAERFKRPPEPTRPYLATIVTRCTN